MGKQVDDAIGKLTSAGYSKESAIKILKSNGTIEQSGKHLTWAGGKKKKHSHSSHSSGY